MTLPRLRCDIVEDWALRTYLGSKHPKLLPPLSRERLNDPGDPVSERIFLGYESDAIGSTYLCTYTQQTLTVQCSATPYILREL